MEISLQCSIYLKQLFKGKCSTKALIHNLESLYQENNLTLTREEKEMYIELMKEA